MPPVEEEVTIGEIFRSQQRIEGSITRLEKDLKNLHFLDPELYRIAHEALVARVVDLEKGQSFVSRAFFTSIGTLVVTILAALIIYAVTH